MFFRCLCQKSYETRVIGNAKPVVDLPTGATTDENRKLSIPIGMDIILILRDVLGSIWLFIDLMRRGALVNKDNTFVNKDNTCIVFYYSWGQ